MTMSQEVMPQERWRTRAVYAPLYHNLAIESIIKGLTPATIHVDDPAHPRIALTWFKGRAWLAGNPEEADTAPFSALLEQYAEHLRHNSAAAYILHYAPESWEEHLDEIISPLTTRRARRLYYHLDASTRTWDLDAPPCYTLAPVDQHLLTRTNLKNLDMVKEEMKSERPTVQDFLEKSIGYCAIHDEEIAAWCMSEYNAGNRCEIGIATAENHRRRGLATITGSAVIARTLAEGINEIGWHCWANNKPSIATAERLGLQLMGEHTVQIIHLGQT
jgi:RimJ/RimL family protein N-acetyltransferase